MYLKNIKHACRRVLSLAAVNILSLSSGWVQSAEQVLIILDLQHLRKGLMPKKKKKKKLTTRSAGIKLKITDTESHL